MKYSIYNKKNIAIRVNIIYYMFRINFESYLNISKCKNISCIKIIYILLVY